MPIEHLHPMIVHFPIVLALLAIGSDLWWLARGRPESGLIQLQTGTILLALGAGMAVVAFALGDMAYDIAVSKGASEAVLENHEGWGTTTTIVFAIAALLRGFLWVRGFDAKPAGQMAAILPTAAVAVMVLVTAYFGGHLVYDLGVNVAAHS